jgi:porphobilinogen synthase
MRATPLRTARPPGPPVVPGDRWTGTLPRPGAACPTRPSSRPSRHRSATRRHPSARRTRREAGRSPPRVGGVLLPSPGMAFPQTRLRRLRRTPGLRGLVRETRLDPSCLVAPLFVAASGPDRAPIEAMPGVQRLSISETVKEAGELEALGIPAVLLFGIPDHKDEEGSGAWDQEGVIQLATRALKAAHPDLLVIADLCLCEYTSHGHCGLLTPQGEVDNDATLELLARTAVSQARAGADVIAPSDMMDGRVGAIRAELDADGLTEVPILAYSAKFASAFYGPFREAAGSAPAFGDRRGY